MSRLKNLFFGRNKSSSNLRGQAYDSQIARDPPVKGSYPVAGNGPNVLEDIQRVQLERESRRYSKPPSRYSEAAEAPNVPFYREDHIERPRTAPNNSHRRYGNGSSDGRTRSEFSMESPSSIFSNSSSSRRNSLRNPAESLLPIPHSPAQTLGPQISRQVQTYQPKKAGDVEHSGAQYNGGVVPLARHPRSDSHSSHRSHVDWPEAYSNIRPSRETSRHRAKAAGLQHYGEDVVERDMSPRDREPRLDLNSPEFSYLKHVYAPKKTSSLRTGDSRTSSALGPVLGSDAGSSDDIQPPSRHEKAAPIRSTTASRPTIPYPLVTDSPSPYSYSTNAGRDDDLSTNGRLAQGCRALSPLSVSSLQQSAMRDTLRQPGSAVGRGRRPLREPPLIVPEPNQSVLPRVFRQSASVPRVATVPENSQAGSRILEESPPVAFPLDLPNFAAPIQEKQTPNSSAKQGQRTMSAASQSSVSSNGHASKGSYSAFPSPSDRSSAKSPISPVTKRSGMWIEERDEPINLEGIVDLSNTVDTDVTTKTLPAVTHEHVTPVRHEILEERVTREIHTHDVYHRILPVLETEILPTKHYVPSDDGKSLIEISENDLYKYTQHTVTGKPNGNWHISKDARPRGQSVTQSMYFHPNISEEDAAEPPTIVLARGEPKNRSRANSRASGSKSLNILEPILSSKKEYMTKEGYPRTEYVWRHPPQFEDMHGRTQPVYIGAALGDLSSPVSSGYYSDDDFVDASFGAERTDGKGEQALLFRDSGYGSAGMLPGLSGQKAPAADYQNKDVVGDWGESISYGRVAIRNDESVRSEGEATRSLRCMKERKCSAASAASKSKGKAVDVGDVERGMSGLNVR